MIFILFVNRSWSFWKKKVGIFDIWDVCYFCILSVGEHLEWPLFNVSILETWNESREFPLEKHLLNLSPNLSIPEKGNSVHRSIETVSRIGENPQKWVLASKEWQLFRRPLEVFWWSTEFPIQKTKYLVWKSEKMKVLRTPFSFPQPKRDRVFTSCIVTNYK